MKIRLEGDREADTGRGRKRREVREKGRKRERKRERGRVGERERGIEKGGRQGDRARRRRGGETEKRDGRPHSLLLPLSLFSSFILPPAFPQNSRGAGRPAPPPARTTAPPAINP